MPVDIPLADQLLIPTALGGGRSFRTLEPAPHTLMNAEVIRQFLDVQINVEQESADLYRGTLGASNQKEPS